jgi:hypothetical protein
MDEKRINSGFAVICLAMAVACFFVFVLLPVIVRALSIAGNGGW